MSVTVGNEQHVGVVQQKLDDGRVRVRIILTGEEVTVPVDQVRNYASKKAEFRAVAAMAEERMQRAKHRQVEIAAEAERKK